MKLSVILIAYNMIREVPRALQSLQRRYQIDCQDLDYEVVVVENGSTEKLDRESVERHGSEFQYHYLEDPPASPAYAINYGVRHSTGGILCIMIDGAHVLTPGVFKFALGAFAALNDPIVLTRYFYMGPDIQNFSILDGYNQEQEDRLFDKIDWPNDGYRLFEVGVPLKGFAPRATWFNRVLESNCLFLTRQVFEAIGGADERFDIPGGGFLNIDLYQEAAKLPGSQPVLLIGEGSFHQVHGGTTTNVSEEKLLDKVQKYEEQYEKIRGGKMAPTQKDVYYFGHLPTKHSKIHQLWHHYNKEM